MKKTLLDCAGCTLPGQHMLCQSRDFFVGPSVAGCTSVKCWVLVGCWYRPSGVSGALFCTAYVVLGFIHMCLGWISYVCTVYSLTFAELNFHSFDWSATIRKSTPPIATVVAIAVIAYEFCTSHSVPKWTLGSHVFIWLRMYPSTLLISCSSVRSPTGPHWTRVCSVQLLFLLQWPSPGLILQSPRQA